MQVSIGGDEASGGGGAGRIGFKWPTLEAARCLPAITALGGVVWQ